MFRLFPVLAFSLFLVLVCWASAAAARCARCDALGLTSSFTFSGQSWRLAGAVELCERDREICRGALPKQVEATDRLLERLQGVNLAVNHAISSLSDKKNYGQEEFWTLPVNSRGDCEDYALEKRRILIEKGIPAGALQIIELRLIKTGEGHAVLGVNTDRGLYILDNLVDDLQTVFSNRGYNFLAIQSPERFDSFMAVNGVRM
ncbi:transglutaminase-like cysteine peptidase [Mesorhizobium sp.]|uniref:transglutaminase-like cysteine peptidase n=1 Tax=Mesorhizobium sp. TaxID=1871066 RepID=UPI000FE34E55|nr:transglutaminase-like cysteine peptidase [Mesorhizobium sp.]RWJ03508.1 MAG: transglutaminase [Mesorhizobium sp.]